MFNALLLGLVVSSAISAAEPRHVVLVVIDGVRAQEWQGRATDDQGKPVPAESLLPNITALRKQGAFFPNVTISNPAGISLPAYADIFAGRRQEKIVDNTVPSGGGHSHHPTIFEVIKDGLKLPYDGVAVHASWQPLCALSIHAPREKARDFYRSCGWPDGLGKARYRKPQVYEGSRTDMDTFVELAAELPRRHPRFTFVHLGNADEEAHLQDALKASTGVHYGIFNYHNALREDDFYVGRIWQLFKSDPLYKGRTWLLVTTDHGRDDDGGPHAWSDHGTCVARTGKVCAACRQSFLLVVGPGVPARTVETAYSHVDLAPTVAALLGVKMPSAQGRPIKELVR